MSAAVVRTGSFNPGSRCLENRKMRPSLRVFAPKSDVHPGYTPTWRFRTRSGALGQENILRQFDAQEFEESLCLRWAADRDPGSTSSAAQNAAKGCVHVHRGRQG